MKRSFIPGDEWLFVKVYMSPGLQDKFLVDKIHPLVDSLYKNEVIDKYFFVRYGDQIGQHLRLRFHLSKNVFIGDLIIEFNKAITPAVRNKAISRVIYDVYERELERYGPKNMDDIESLFSADSYCLQQMINVKSKYNMLDQWYPLVKWIDSFLSRMRLDISKKQALFETMYLNYSKILNVDKDVKEFLKDKNRAHSKALTGFLTAETEIPFCKQPAYVVPGFTLSDLLMRNSKDEAKLNQLLADLIHMNINRFFSHDQNRIELIIYFITSNVYRSMMANNKV